MTGNLRSVLFHLLGGISVLSKIKDKLQSAQSISQEEKQNLNTLIDFIKQIRQDTHLYLSGQKLSQKDIDDIFINFLTGLSFVEDKRLSRGPAFAVANVALDSNQWSHAIREFNEEHEQLLDKRLGRWIDSLEKLQNGTETQEVLEQLNQILIVFEETTKILEHA